MTNLRNLTDADLNREVAHARNRRDAFAAGREPADVMANLRRLLDEQARRRAERRAGREHERFVYAKRTSDGVETGELDVTFARPVTLDHATRYLQGLAERGKSELLYVRPA